MGAEATVHATGVRLDECDGSATPRVRMTPESRADVVAWQRGELVFLSATAFVDFDAGEGLNRWTGTPQGPYGVALGTDATSFLLERAWDLDDLFGDLRMSDYRVSRFDFYAAPRRIELDDPLREKLTLG